MENRDGIAVFDTLFTNNHICMMKLLLPVLPPSLQKNIALYIKFSELKVTLQYFAKHSPGMYPSDSSASKPIDVETLCEDILPYCTAGEKETITQIHNMIRTFQNMKDMMETMETIKELFPEGMNEFNPGNNDITQMMDLFQAFQNQQI